MQLVNRFLDAVVPVARRVEKVMAFLYSTGAALLYGFLLPGLLDVGPPDLPGQANLATSTAVGMLLYTWWSMHRAGISETGERWLGATLLLTAVVPTARWVRFGDPDAEFRLFMRVLAASVAVGWMLVALWQRYRRQRIREMAR